MTPQDRVAIRPYAAEDLGLLERLLGDAAMMSHLGGPETPDALRARHERYLASTEAEGALFTVLVGSKAVPAGWVGYWESEWDGEPVWECGWHVLPGFQGAGVASGAMMLLLSDLRMRKTHSALHAFPRVDNEASNRLCARLGFELLGEVAVEYPMGHMMHGNNWRLRLQ